MRPALYAACIAIAAFIAPSAATTQTNEIRFGLTAVVVRENLRFFDRWAEYLSLRIGRPVRFVQRKTYREITDMLAADEIQVAWICGYPFVRHREPEYLQLLAVPLFRGSPLYRSYVIVNRNSSFQQLDELQGRVFAYSDPDSNSGYLVPRTILARQEYDPSSFFRLTFFTYSHAETVEAVAQQVADGGAVDSYVWEFLAMTRPELASRTRVIAKSEQFAFPPIVARADLDPKILSRLRDALMGMPEDDQGKKLLEELALDGFAPGSTRLYDSIRVIGRKYGEGVTRLEPKDDANAAVSLQ